MLVSFIVKENPERKPGRDHLLTRFRDDSAVEISVTFKHETNIRS